MKKFLLLLVAVMSVCAAHATDYSNYYVNILGNFNGWKNNGVQTTTGITTHSSLAIGTSEFKVKVYTQNNNTDSWYSTGGAIAQNQWAAISGNNNNNMTIAGAVEGQKFRVDFNLDGNKIRVTPIDDNGNPTFTALYLRGSFPDLATGWPCDEKYVMTTTDGITYTYGPTTFEAGLNFKIGSKDWDESWGPSDSNNSTIDLTGTSSKTLTAKDDKSSENFTVSQSMSDVTVTLNTLTNNLTITGVITAGIEGVEAEAGEAEAEYFTVAGVRADNPTTPGLYVRRQGNKTSKVVIR